jgi:hypothetical protein
LAEKIERNFSFSSTGLLSIQSFIEHTLMKLEKTQFSIEEQAGGARGRGMK